MLINQSTIEQCKKERFFRLAKALSDVNTRPEILNGSPDMLCQFLVDFMTHSKHAAKKMRLRRSSELSHPCAELEHFDWRAQPNIAKSQLAYLTSCKWIGDCQHLVLTGCKGEEKNRLACALANRAMEERLSAKYYDMKTLVFELRTQYANDTFDSFISQINQFDLLLIAHWDNSELALEDIMLLCTLLEAREKSLLITTDINSCNWHDHLSKSRFPASVITFIKKFSRVLDVKEQAEQTIH